MGSKSLDALMQPLVARTGFFFGDKRHFTEIRLGYRLRMTCNILKHGCLFFLLFMLSMPAAYAEELPLDSTVCLPGHAPKTEVHVHLLTMPPGDVVFSVFGHTGLWISDGRDGSDVVYNFGFIDFSSVSVTRFLQGQLKFLSVGRSYDWMLNYYAQEERMIYAQRLRIGQPEARELARTLKRIVSSEDERKYVYHWRKNNCVTRIRDLLDETMGGALSAGHADPAPMSGRDDALRHLGPHLHLWFGWHLAASAAVDRPMTRWDASYVPDRLKELIEDTSVETPEGVKPLVQYACILLQGKHGWAPAEPPKRSGWLGLLGLILGGFFWGLGVLASRSERFVVQRVLGVLIAIWGLIAGGLGTALFYLWITSTYPTAQQNENLFFANPLTLALVPLGIALLIRWSRGVRIFEFSLIGLIAVGLLGLVLGWVLPQANAGFGAFFVLPLIGILGALRVLRTDASSA